MTNKTKLGEIEMVALTKECNLVMLSKIPKKLNDTESFTLPVQIGESNVVHDLSDLGAIIN